MFDNNVEAAGKPAIVLVHGAWADSSCWNDVIAPLQADGYTVYAPPNPLRSLATDAASVAQHQAQLALVVRLKSRKVTHTWFAPPQVLPDFALDCVDNIQESSPRGTAPDNEPRWLQQR
jgi:pimeloyl-ACP methyl ester carboxylesterase